MLLIHPNGVLITQPQAGQIGVEEDDQIHWRDLPDRTVIPIAVPDWMNPNTVPEPIEAPVEVPVKRTRKKKS